jgi:hypothetical protein
MYIHSCFTYACMQMMHHAHTHTHTHTQTYRHAHDLKGRLEVFGQVLERIVCVKVLRELEVVDELWNVIFEVPLCARKCV